MRQRRETAKRAFGTIKARTNPRYPNSICSSNSAHTIFQGLFPRTARSADYGLAARRNALKWLSWAALRISRGYSMPLLGKRGAIEALNLLSDIEEKRAEISPMPGADHYQLMRHPVELPSSAPWHR